MTNEEKIERAKQITKTIDSIDKILRRCMFQRASWAKDSVRNSNRFGGFLTKFFSTFAHELGDIPTPDELNLEVLTMVEDFYMQKKIELEHELINIH